MIPKEVLDRLKPMVNNSTEDHLKKQTIQCCVCNKLKPVISTCYDPQGKAFIAYYCEDCVKESKENL